MKRMGTMKRMVRLAVGSLCLLALMVHGASAATATSPVFECVTGAFLDQPGVKGGLTATWVLSNYDSQAPHQYTVIVFSKAHPQGISKNVTLQASETKQLSRTDLGLDPSGTEGWSAILGDYPANAVLMLKNDTGGITAMQAACFEQQPQQ